MIKSDEFFIRAVEREDINTICEWSSQSFRGDYQEFHLTSKQEVLQRFESGKMFSEYYQMLFIESHKNEPIGWISVNFVRDGLISLGVVLSPHNRNNGIGGQATKLVTEYLFDNYNVARIQAETDVQNIPAQKVLEKCGFTKEGVLRSYRYHHGKYNDSFMYSLIRTQ